MYTRNFKALMTECLQITLQLRRLNEGMEFLHLKMRRDTIVKKMRHVGKTSDVYKISALVKGEPLETYLVDINPDEIGLILHFQLGTSDIRDIKYFKVLSKSAE